MMTDRMCLGSRAVRSAFAALIALALALSGAGCATTTGAPGTYATLEAVVIDAQRLARGDEMAQVRVWRGTSLVPTQPGMALQPGDLVQTGPNAYAVLRYPNAEVMLRSNSQGRVGSLVDVLGEVFVKLRGAFSVETSFVRAGASGTAYSVRGATDGSAAVIVFDGGVTLSSRVGAWAPQQLASGTTTLCPPRGGAPQTRPASAQDMEQTRAWVERLETLVPQRSRYGGVAAVAAIAVLIGVILGSRSSSGRDAQDSGNYPGRTGRDGSR